MDARETVGRGKKSVISKSEDNNVWHLDVHLSLVDSLGEMYNIVKSHVN